MKKNTGKYCKLFAQRNILLLADAFQNLSNKYVKTCKIDSTYFSTSPGLAWTATLKRKNIKLQSLTDTDMQSMVEDRIRG